MSDIKTICKELKRTWNINLIDRMDDRIKNIFKKVSKQYINSDKGNRKLIEIIYKHFFGARNVDIKKNVIYIKRFFDPAITDYLFNRLKTQVKWVAGIRSRNGFTRKAYMVDNNDPLMFELIPYIKECLGVTEQKFGLLGIYLNYYENGNMYTPTHSHKDTHQLVISLGGSRTFVLGKKKIKTEDGDMIIFGPEPHSIPKEEVAEPRISIATFMVPIK